jgi:type I restriction enzyme, S subunit
MPKMLKQNQVFRFDQMAVQVKDKVDPAEADVDRYVGLEHIDPESLKIRRWGETSEVASSKIIFKSGDIIFGKRRAYQRKLAVADFDGICSAHAMVLQPKTDVVLDEFLPFFMQSDIFMDRAVKISVGGLSPTINWRDLAKEEFSLPTLDEQQRIAETLKAAESLIEESANLMTAASVLSERWRIDFIEHANASACKLLDVCILRGGSGFKVEHQGQSEGELPFIKVSDMNLAGNEKCIIAAQNYISAEQASELKARVMPQGAVVFAKVGAALLQNRRRILAYETCIDNNMMAAIPDPKKLSSEYLYLLLLGIDFRELVQEGVIPSVNQATLGRVAVRIPDIKKQQLLLQEWNTLESAKGKSALRLSRARDLKKDILKGRVV